MSCSHVVRDLGVLLDLELTFSHHIDQMCRNCYMTFNAAVSLVHAFVFSHLDYCSSIFAGLPGVRMEKLRRVHRAVARLIGGFKKIDHIILIYVGCIALASIPTAHLIQDRVLGVAVSVWLGANSVDVNY